ncbi:MAG: lytic transglycosylase domain-containing protein [Rhodospirillaceae bacterium]
MAAGLVLAAGGAAGAGSLGERDLDLYRAAFRYAQQDKWSEALARGAEPEERLPGKVIRWMDLARPKSGHSFSDIAAFVRVNPGWPNQTGLLRQAEETMPAELAASEVVAWFEAHAPVSALGVGRFAEALTQRGDAGRAAALVRRFWLEANFVTAEDEAAFRRRFAAVLLPRDHLARLDRVLWDHHGAAAQRLLALVDDDQRALAEARLALADDSPGLEAALRRVPEALQSHPGLAWERLHWRRRKDNDFGALDVLNTPPPELVRPALWWSERHILARRLLEKHDAPAAYRLVAAHGLTEGQPLAEAEFLAGWLALRQLRQPREALAHFERMLQAVSSPMSRARGAYWCARAAEAMGERDDAEEWYGKAAAFPSMFYGQLAAAALGRDRPVALPAEPAVAAEEAARFERRELVRVARLLYEIDPRDNADRVGLFLRRMIRDASTASDWVLLGRMAIELRQPEEAIFAAKQAFQNGVVLSGSGYPMISLHRNGGIEPGLALALIRQESTFNTTIVSSAGARGLMQLMPATARMVARKLQLRPSDERLTEDPDYNILLGTTYIRGLIDSYGGSYLLAIAAYNAGSGRVDSWLGKFGDPRGPGVDPLDWIESIPIAETRNYVQRVLEALQVYRARLGQGGHTLKQDLVRR